MRGRMTDGKGIELEVIVLDRGRGPVECIRLTWRRYLVGPGTPPLPPGYYRTAAAALAVLAAVAGVDVASLVEVIELRP